MKAGLESHLLATIKTETENLIIRDENKIWHKGQNSIISGSTQT